MYHVLVGKGIVVDSPRKPRGSFHSAIGFSVTSEQISTLISRIEKDKKDKSLTYNIWFNQSPYDKNFSIKKFQCTTYALNCLHFIGIDYRNLIGLKNGKIWDRPIQIAHISEKLMLSLSNQGQSINLEENGRLNFFKGNATIVIDARGIKNNDNLNLLLDQVEQKSR